MGASSACPNSRIDGIGGFRVNRGRLWSRELGGWIRTHRLSLGQLWTSRRGICAGPNRGVRDGLVRPDLRVRAALHQALGRKSGSQE